MAEEVEIVVKTDTKDVSKLGILLDKLGDKIKSVTTGFAKGLENVGNKFRELPGPIGQMAGGVIDLGKSMLTLVANPIGAFLALLVGTFVALKNSLSAGLVRTSVGVIPALSSGLKLPSRSSLNIYFCNPMLRGIIKILFSFPTVTAFP